MTTLLSADIQLKNAEREKLRQQQDAFFQSGGKVSQPEIKDQNDYNPGYRLNQKARKNLSKQGINHTNR